MTEIDLSRLPTGSMGWRTLVEWAAESDDRVERFFLELKSDVDLTTKHGRHKVAKFILGSAHRDPTRASKRFGGHAIMLLGVGHKSVVGIEPFEAKDLAREVAKFTGADGPIWDYELIPVDEGHDVVAVVVDPPTGRVWPCLADGEGLVDGDVYIRGDGETAKAKGSEVQAIMSRTAAVSTLPSVQVELLGPCTAIQVDDSALLKWIDERTLDLRDQGRPQPKSTGLQILTPASMDRRTRGESLAEVEEWTKAATADPRSGVRDLVAAMTPAIRVRIRNETKQFLRDVRVDIEFDGDVEALEWIDREGAVVFPDVPKDFGTESITHMLADHSWRAAMASTGDRELLVHEHSPAKIYISMEVLRPEEDFVSDDNEVVITRMVDNPDAIELTGRWRLTAGDIHDVRSGEFSLTPEFRDWVEPLNSMLEDDS